MIAAPFISALLFSASAWAETSSFYAKISNKYELLANDEHWDESVRKILVLHQSDVAFLPDFNLQDGYAVTADSPSIERFGIFKDHLVFGPENTVEPFKMELDADLKITNLNTHICKPLKSENFRGFLANKDMSGLRYKCNPVEIYFLTSSEAKRRMSSPGNHKKVEVEKQPMHYNDENFATGQNKKNIEEQDELIDNVFTFTGTDYHTRYNRMFKRYDGEQPTTTYGSYPTPNMMNKRQDVQHEMPVATTTLSNRVF